MRKGRQKHDKVVIMASILCKHGDKIIATRQMTDQLHPVESPAFHSDYPIEFGVSSEWQV